MKTLVKHPMATRFRGYYPVVVDVETGGLDPKVHALLEIAAAPLTLNAEGKLSVLGLHQFHILPDPQCLIDPSSLKINKINLEEHQTYALPEALALRKLFGLIRTAMKAHGCQRSILVGHNAAFDLSFMKAGAERQHLKRSPFHPFCVIDTVGLSALVYGQTTLQTACETAGIPFNKEEAHRAQYDTEKTAALLCAIDQKLNVHINHQNDHGTLLQTDK